MKFYHRCLFYVAVLVLGSLLSTDIFALTDDELTAGLSGQIYIYDEKGHLKKTIDSSGATPRDKSLKACKPINTTDSQTQSPRRSGKEGEAQVKRELEAKGAKVLGEEITLKTSEGITRVDFVIKTAEGNWEIIEVKNGPSARLPPNQQKAFGVIQQSGAMPVGDRAAKAGLPVGGQIGSTPVRIIRVVTCP